MRARAHAPTTPARAPLVRPCVRYIDRTRYLQTQPPDTRKSGFLSSDARRRDEFTLDIETQKWRERIGQEMDFAERFAKRQDAEMSAEERAEMERLAEPPKRRWTHGPKYLFDLGKEAANGTTPYNMKDARDTWYSKQRVAAQNDGVPMKGSYVLSSTAVGDNLKSYTDWSKPECATPRKPCPRVAPAAVCAPPSPRAASQVCAPAGDPRQLLPLDGCAAHAVSARRQQLTRSSPAAPARHAPRVVGLCTRGPQRRVIQDCGGWGLRGWWALLRTRRRSRDRPATGDDKRCDYGRSSSARAARAQHARALRARPRPRWTAGPGARWHRPSWPARSPVAQTPSLAQTAL